MSIKILASKKGGAGGPKLIASSVDPTAAASLALSGLLGNTDIIYEVLARLVKDGTAGRISLRCNADSGGNYNWTAQGFINAAVGYTGGQLDTSLGLMNTDSPSLINPNDYFDCRLILFAKSGYKRRVISHAVTFAQRSGTPLIESYYAAGEWTNTANELTSITFVSSAGNIGGTGTFIRAYAIY